MNESVVGLFFWGSAGLSTRGIQPPNVLFLGLQTWGEVILICSDRMTQSENEVKAAQLEMEAEWK